MVALCAHQSLDGLKRSNSGGPLLIKVAARVMDRGDGSGHLIIRPWKNVSVSALVFVCSITLHMVAPKE